MAQAARAEHDCLEAHADSAVRRLTDLIMGTDIVVGGLVLVIDTLDDWDDPFTIQILSSKGEKITLSRTRPELKNILKEEISDKQYEKSLVFAVAEAEDHIASYIRIILQAYPDRLIRGPSGGTSEKSVLLTDIISMDRNNLLNSIIEKRINSRMGELPRTYLRYLSQVIGCTFSTEIVDRFCEVCATRDVTVHCQGKIDRKYIDKAGRLARGTIGEFAVVDETYFQSSMANIRSIYEEIYAATRREFGKDEKIAAVLSEIYAGE